MRWWLPAQRGSSVCGAPECGVSECTVMVGRASVLRIPETTGGADESTQARVLFGDVKYHKQLAVDQRKNSEEWTA